MDETPELRGLRNVFESSLDALETEHNARAEMRGLEAIVNSAGTLHGIKEPPDPADFSDYSYYERAYEQWWLDVCCWKITRRDAESPDA